MYIRLNFLARFNIHINIRLYLTHPVIDDAIKFIRMNKDKKYYINNFFIASNARSNFQLLYHHTDIMLIGSIY